MLLYSLVFTTKMDSQLMEIIGVFVSKHILILGSPVDEHALAVFKHLKSKGALVEFIDSVEFPEHLGLSLRMPENQYEIHLQNGKSISQKDITSIYWRNYNGININSENYIAKNDTRSLFESFLRSKDMHWVNGYEGFYKHQNKPFAMQLVSKILAVKVPKTLFSNDPQQIRQFVSEVGDCIFKPVQGGAHTKKISAEHLNEKNLASLRESPVCIQERIAGTNVRIFVAGAWVGACTIDTDEVDFRDDQQPNIKELKINAQQKQMAKDICDALDLRWSGIDFRMQDNGDLYYLEANPSPMFMGFEKLSGLPLMEALTNLLMRQ